MASACSSQAWGSRARGLLRGWLRAPPAKPTTQGCAGAAPAGSLPLRLATAIPAGSGCVAMPWLLFSTQRMGLNHGGRKARAQTAGYELALSLRHSESGYTNFVREHSSCNVLRYSCCSLGEGDLSLALLHVAETLRSQQSILLVHLKLTSGVAIQMLMRHPRPLLYLEVPGGRDTVCSPSTIWGRDDSVQ